MKFNIRTYDMFPWTPWGTWISTYEEKKRDTILFSFPRTLIAAKKNPQKTGKNSLNIQSVHQVLFPSPPILF